MSAPMIPAEELVTMLNDVADDAIVRHMNSDDETFLECRVCGEWDSHTDICPIPAIEHWLRASGSEPGAAVGRHETEQDSTRSNDLG